MLSTGAPHRDQPSGIPRGIWQLDNFSVLRLHGDRTSDAEGCEGKILIGNIVPKQWKLSGFLQHPSANTIYI